LKKNYKNTRKWRRLFEIIQPSSLGVHATFFLGIDNQTEVVHDTVCIVLVQRIAEIQEECDRGIKLKM
jgi:hypothetical protein